MKQALAALLLTGYLSRKLVLFLFLCLSIMTGVLVSRWLQLSDKLFETAVDGMLTAYALYLGGNVGAKFIAAKAPSKPEAPAGK